MTLRKKGSARWTVHEIASSEGRASGRGPSVSILGLACLLLVSLDVAYARQHSNAGREVNWNAMGSTPCVWSPPVVDAQGAIDPGATFRVLKASGLSCYGALIWSQRDHGSKVFNWPDFKKFVAAAHPEGISVWAVLIPPSEGGNSPPFNRDYVRWMKELAKVSVRFPNLRGVNIDDYVSGISEKTFTPAYTCELYRAKQVINPKFQFVPTIYDLDRSLAEKYGACIDGVWLWWTNLDSSNGLHSWLENTRLAVGGRFPIYSGVYAHQTSWHSAAPKPGMFRRTLETACRSADGAVTWQMPLTPLNPYLEVARSFGKGGSSEAAGHCGNFVSKPDHAATK